jgi:hypothetical protein
MLVVLLAIILLLALGGGTFHQRGPLFPALVILALLLVRSRF